MNKAIRALFVLLMCFSFIAPSTFAYMAVRSRSNANFEAAQMADILGVRSQLDRYVQIRTSAESDEQRALRSQILQKILLGYIEVRRACDRNDRELSFSYNVMRRAQRMQDLINEGFTLMNFAQLGTLYSMEPFLRLNKQFHASAECTQTGSAVGLFLPVASMVQQRTARTRDVAPPKSVLAFISGGPVDTSALPPYVEAFLQTPAPGANISRKEEMFEQWKTRYGVDPRREDTLVSLRDGKSKTIHQLNTRILLLWSLRTYILDMDNSLLNLLKEMSPNVRPASDQDNSAALKALGLDARAIEAARLLRIQGQVGQLLSANANKDGSIDQRTKETLELNLLESVLYGALEVRVSADQIDSEINYANDVVLSELLAKRGKALQRNFEMNFIQAGVFGSIAGYKYLERYPKVGNEMFVISGGIGTALSINALRILRGGKRPIDGKPNSLADVFNLPIEEDYKFSPIITEFLSSKAPDSQLNRSEQLINYWKEHKVTSVNIDKKKTTEALAGEPSAKYDTIKIVSNRVSMLHELLAHLESFDGELLALLRETGAAPIPANSAPVEAVASLTPVAAETVKLIDAGVQLNVVATNNKSGDSLSPAIVAARCELLRKILVAALDVRVAEDILDAEIAIEYDVLGRMTRSRDQTIALTNNVNFFQLNILATIIDGELGLSGNPRWVRASNMLNIVSGLSVGGLALLSVLEQRGGYRPSPAEPNMVGQCLGVAPPNEYKFSLPLWQFLHGPPPNSADGKSRVQIMVQSWNQTKFVSMNMDKQSNKEKAAAYGPHHTKWTESIKLIKNRLNMMFDVRGLIGLFNDGLDDSLRVAS